jgi:hypothetical protein
MKKVIKTLILAFVISSVVEKSQAQTFPYGINYQAVARDANGNAKQNQQVPVQFTIYQHSTTGTMVYQERQVLTTNVMGQFTSVIGNGAPVTPYNTSSFSQLNWGADSMFLKVEINSNTSFTGTFTPMGNTTKFQSVPYALYSVSTKLKAPTVQTFTAGSGTYTTPAGVLYIEVRMVGGGGGGAGSSALNTNDGGSGGNGGNTTFGTSLLLAGGGGGGLGGANCQGGTGGSASLGSLLSGLAIVGGGGGASHVLGGSNNGTVSGMGGSSAFGGGAAGAQFNGIVGNVAAVNSGGGGSGASATSGGPNSGGAGGGSGGYVECIIVSLAATYTYAVGTAGTAGNAGSSGQAGGSGGSGVIIIKEYYQ